MLSSLWWRHIRWGLQRGTCFFGLFIFKCCSPLPFCTITSVLVCECSTSHPCLVCLIPNCCNTRPSKNLQCLLCPVNFNILPKGQQILGMHLTEQATIIHYNYDVILFSFIFVICLSTEGQTEKIAQAVRRCDRSLHN